MFLILKLLLYLLTLFYRRDKLKKAEIAQKLNIELLLLAIGEQLFKKNRKK